MYMTSYDFIQKFLGLLPENYEPETLKLLAGAADTTKDGCVLFAWLLKWDIIVIHGTGY